MKITKFLLLILILGSSNLFAKGISVTQAIDKTSIEFNDSLEFRIILQWEGNQSAYLFNKPLNPYFDRLKVGSFSSSIGSKIQGEIEITEKVYRYILKPTSSGSGTIDPISINYLIWPDSIMGELLTEPATIEIAKPKPVKKTESTNLTYWLLGALMLGGLAGVGSYLKYKSSGKDSDKPKTPREAFLDNLETIKTEAKSDLKVFQTGLYKSLEEYIDNAYSVFVGNSDFEELHGQLHEAGMKNDNAEKILGWLFQAKKDKFSPVQAEPGQVIRMVSEIKQFFENNSDLK